jgi:hypothetical protein
MPNWVYNTLEIRGDKKELEKFKKIVDTSWYLGLNNQRGERLDFETLISMPEELDPNIVDSNLDKKQKRINRKKFGVPDWYEWRIRFWGCKWNCNNVAVDWAVWNLKGLTSLIYNFETPWGAPIEWIETSSILFPELIFKLCCKEESNAFEGCITFKNGHHKHNKLVD